MTALKHMTVNIHTDGEKFYNITALVRQGLSEYLNKQYPNCESGILQLFVTHTSCSLTISEAFDPNAAIDLEAFLKALAPRDASFITHTTEGPDDSPSHMKSAILHQTIGLIVENKDVILGTWQGIFLAEFRDSPKNRKILLKFIPDPS